MSHVLVAYASKHGATAEIAEAVADEIRRHGHEVDCLPADQADDVGSYDAAVLGSAVYVKRWMGPARKLLSRQADDLAERPFWVFSSGPCGESPDPSWAEPPRTIKRAERLGARDHVVFGGWLPIEPSNFMEKAMVEKTPKDQRDLRDWDEIRGWGRQIAEALGGTAAGSL
jgi:menaquinone-dependent protoporphyrinogen oxidase